jgi:hypothetical protein
MTNIYFKPTLGAPGDLAPEPVKYHRADGPRAMAHGLTALSAKPGFDAVGFSLSGIWDASNDLSGRAWDAINNVLARVGGGGGGGGARKIVSSDEAEIVATTRAPAPSGPQT